MLAVMVCDWELASTTFAERCTSSGFQNSGCRHCSMIAVGAVHLSSLMTPSQGSRVLNVISAVNISIYCAVINLNLFKTNIVHIHGLLHDQMRKPTQQPSSSFCQLVSSAKPDRKHFSLIFILISKNNIFLFVNGTLSQICSQYFSFLLFCPNYIYCNLNGAEDGA